MFLQQSINTTHDRKMHNTDRRMRIMLPCFLPCTLPLRPAKTSPSQRDRDIDTRIPGDNPTNLLLLSATSNSRFVYEGKDLPKY